MTKLVSGDQFSKGAKCVEINIADDDVDDNDDW